MRSVALALALVAETPAFADSPVTSTDFFRAYRDDPLVKQVRRARRITPAIAEALATGDLPLDRKVAAINALGWSGGMRHARAFEAYLVKRHDRSLETIDHLGADEALAYGYLVLLGDYFHPRRALPALRHAKAKLPESFTASMVLALAESQDAMDRDWCQVWRIGQRVLDDRQMHRDMRPKAVGIIRRYLILYRDSC
jgi:hypothetical protein